MNIKEIASLADFEIVCTGDDPEREITSIYCCDLLSIVMGRAPADGVWITVMGNINAIAVAVLTDLSCIVLAEGVTLDAEATEKAAIQGVTVLKTKLPIFESSQLLADLLK